MAGGGLRRGVVEALNTASYFSSFPALQQGVSEPSRISMPWKEHAAYSTINTTDTHAAVKLDSLQSDGMRSLLSVVDQLRRVGLNSVLSLPQLVVCGDQSSGKSSVLEAITQIPFPRNAMLCTRFATEIILRRDTKESITAKVIPGDTRSPERRKQLLGFEKSITDFSKLPDLVHEATTLMEDAGSEYLKLKAFFADMLSITVSGSNMHPLTLVDLPGLIHSETQTQSKMDVNFIDALVTKYISNPRSIILAVVSAKHDYANQIILQKARGVDPKGSRTLGIITKPDCLEENSAEEKIWTTLAQNKDIQFELGWHMLRNRTQAEILSSFEERDVKEREFFEGRAIYKSMDKETLGIGPLRERLSHLLFAHLKREIPKLNEELNEALAKKSTRLAALGEQRDTLPDIRAFLTSSSMKYNAILTDALTGHYNDKFFRHGTKAPSTPDISVKLRAAIQYYNSNFAKLMLEFGAKYNFHGVPPEVANVIGKDEEAHFDQNLKSLNYAKPLQKVKSRSEAVAWVYAKMQLSRGEELPGTINATILKELYWEQTANWKTITLTYIDILSDYIQRFSKTLVQHTMPADVAERIWDHRIFPRLALQKKNAVTELERIMEDNDNRAPMTYNHYYTDTIQKLRHQKLMAKVKRVVDSMSPNATGSGKSINAELFLKTIDQKFIEPDMEKFAAEEVLDCLMALYKDKLKNFIATVTETIIERHLVGALRDSPISPTALTKLSDDEIHHLAAEPQNVRSERSQLSAMKSSLEVGKEAFQSALLQFD
ncbi:Interferon-induced GTP-binding protein Mx [Lasiodiplodia hormozganensis]|uniref:Interferon-induced GTP-binding protein Mx n=1 Tax=Lasiodiplodia hormozganensis TaxID=869390 RepID=A0AA40CS92_9PEZI|nr:Interferon-induced GTP-binding protein Mx [Lasiodiplodia hormozganensis]